MKRWEHRREAHFEIRVLVESFSEEPGWVFRVGLASLGQSLASLGQDLASQGHSAFLVLGLVFQGLDWASQGQTAFQERSVYQTGFVGEQVEL